MAKKKVANNKSVTFIVMGGLLFVLRYVPVYHYRTALLDQWFSLERANALCGTFVGNFMTSCSWVKPLNIGVILLSIGLVVYGAYQLYVNRNK